ncbi:MAG TPA: hypothetical protein P5268_07280 [Candidatus Marinimicrobia bacterium]|nr:hypothetical protein [Candidatus Neomarinimicrobiota bacterium]HRS51104.1 hypothetical protein [Candidatus Neomarinimicrobiota bacterium]HRU92817.1 hypothetical protein [Candidatus Neomarinimicrobiota bacterium]
MFKNYDPQQMSLFPDLFEDIYLPPITTLPEFNQEMDNFIKLADFGALIDLTFQGLDKSYSLRLSELQIPAQMIRDDARLESPIFDLFPLEYRRRLQRFRYEVKAFFNNQNSIKTPDGYFLFRAHFHQWENYRSQFYQKIVNYLQNDIGPHRYRNFFETCFKSGLDWLNTQLRPIHPYQVQFADLQEISRRRKSLQSTRTTLAQLTPEDPEYLLNCITLKTLHIPITLAQFIKGIAINSTFKTIHLNYLKDVKIETLRDVKHLLESIARQPNQ